MTIIELMTALTSSATISEAAEQAANSGIAGAKDVYLAWGKSEGHVVKELESAWKEAQPVKAKGGARGFADVYYNWLAEDERTEQEAADYINSSDSQNVRNHLTHYLNIWALVATVRAGQNVSRTIVGSKTEASATKEPTAEKKPAAKKDNWEYDASQPYADVRSAWETLERVRKSKRPAKTKVAPEKVAHLEDADVTDAYTKAFEVYSA